MQKKLQEFSLNDPQYDTYIFNNQRLAFYFEKSKIN